MLGNDKGDTAYLHLEQLSSTLAVIGRDDRGMNVHKAIVLEERKTPYYVCTRSNSKKTRCILLLKWTFVCECLGGVCYVLGKP